MTTSALFAGVRSGSVRGSRIGSLLMGVLLCGPKARVGCLRRSALDAPCVSDWRMLRRGTLRRGRAQRDWLADARRRLETRDACPPTLRVAPATPRLQLARHTAARRPTVARRYRPGSATGAVQIDHR